MWQERVSALSGAFGAAGRRHIFIGEDEITAKGARVDAIRSRMGMVYQGFHLFEHMDVLEHITLAPIRLRGLSLPAAEEKAMELLRMVELESKRHALPATLSVGQKQRIAICRCLAMEPRVMLFDEPTSVLDPAMVGAVKDGTISQAWLDESVLRILKLKAGRERGILHSSDVLKVPENETQTVAYPPKKAGAAASLCDIGGCRKRLRIDGRKREGFGHKRAPRGAG